MTDTEIERRLRSTGKACFVRCFAAHSGYAAGTLSYERYVADLCKAGYRPEGAPWRKAVKPIFVNGRERDALRNVLDSRVSSNIKDEARRLLSDLAFG